MTQQRGDIADKLRARPPFFRKTQRILRRSSGNGNRPGIMPRKAAQQTFAHGARTDNENGFSREAARVRQSLLDRSGSVPDTAAAQFRFGAHTLSDTKRPVETGVCEKTIGIRLASEPIGAPDLPQNLVLPDDF